MTEFKLPDVGEGLTEAEIVTWQVKVGDVGQGQRHRGRDRDREVAGRAALAVRRHGAGAARARGRDRRRRHPDHRIGDGAAPAPAAVDRERALPGARREGRRRRRPRSTCRTRPRPAGGENQTLVGYGPRAASAQRRPRRGAASPATDAGAAAQLQLQGAFGQGARETADVVAADEPPVPATPARARGGAGRASTCGCSPSPRSASSPRTSASTSAAGHPDRPRRDDHPRRRPGRERGSGCSAGAPAVPVEAPAAAARPTGEREPREPIKGVRKMTAQAMVDSAFTAPHVTEWITVDVTRTMRLVDKLQGAARVPRREGVAAARGRQGGLPGRPPYPGDQRDAGTRPPRRSCSSLRQPRDRGRHPARAGRARTSRTPTRCRCPSSPRPSAS